jgi:hypothetical protein
LERKAVFAYQLTTYWLPPEEILATHQLDWTFRVEFARSKVLTLKFISLTERHLFWYAWEAGESSPSFAGGTSYACYREERVSKLCEWGVSMRFLHSREQHFVRRWQLLIKAARIHSIVAWVLTFEILVQGYQGFKLSPCSEGCMHSAESAIWMLAKHNTKVSPYHLEKYSATFDQSRMHWD